MTFRVFRIMDGTVLQFTAEGEADMFLVMDLHPIDAHILDTSIRVFGDHTRGTEIWSAVTARSPNGSGELQKAELRVDRKSTRLNSSHLVISYAVFCLKKKNHNS